ncbi:MULTISPECIES: hypothetical protein [Pseudomonas]|uniref:Uncharacterized protein n=1 Tax=Pseudomonas carnis TaxID=2487355 RepID=A0ABT5RP50_9PSED|nr:MULTISPECIES: hypothetical protein [Pseudomonas]MDD1947774.1 hypothetical protein [Pseudomonas carnis]CAH0230862.1 hypothetical protein SRABI111_02662 [Pseudomonas carnis]CAH0254564.1 hypothetical protein SRABI110_03329 [Pseudomonas carnis]CAH0272774.1 hypothetical protein SRABI08_03668 [Pseudomonas carnis]CAH0310084.1 hypothetical protein SRABI64_04754 [Pseudomonas carnis]
MRAKEITFTASSILSEPTSSSWLRVTADADPSDVLQCFELGEVIEEFGADDLLEHMGIAKVREWIEANE